MRSIFTHQSQSGFRTVLLLILSIVLMVMEKRSDNFAFIRAGMSLPLAPFEYLINWPTQIVGSVKDTFMTHYALLNENNHLKADQLILRTQLQRLNAIESENAYLKSLLQSSHQVKGKMLIAELLAVDIEPFVHQVILNKGKRDGLYVGQPVLDANGVMGQIIQVGPITSRVLLINDPHSGVAIQSARNGLRAVAMGDTYSDKLRVMYISHTADINVGDLFITSGLGGHYPEGYPVGRVTSVKKDPVNQFATVYLQPMAHLNSSRQVLLIWNQ